MADHTPWKTATERTNPTVATSMTRFINTGKDEKVDCAIKKANELLMAESIMIKAIKNKNDFEYGSGLGAAVALNLVSSRDPIDVKTYKPLYPFSKALGYYDGESIWINMRKMHAMSESDLVGLLLHEYAHYCKFMHGSNYKSRHKCLYSVPYFLSENAKFWLDTLQ